MTVIEFIILTLAGFTLGIVIANKWGGGMSRLTMREIWKNERKYNWAKI